MKKFLIATTALTLAAGAAAAQDVSTRAGSLTISGEARFGVGYTSTPAAGNKKTQLENRLTLDFNIVRETDSGVKFGAHSRLRIQRAGANNSGFSGGSFTGSRVWVEASGVRLTVGNQHGAVRGIGASHGHAGGCGIGYEGGIQCWDAAGIIGTAQAQWDVADNVAPTASTAIRNMNRVRVDYTLGGTALALSHDRNGSTELAARHKFGDFTVAGAIKRGGGVGHTNISTVSAAWSANGYTVGAIIARVGVNTNGSISAAANFGANSVYGYVGRIGGNSTFGLNYAYDLGGAKIVVGGERRSTVGSVASVGAVFTF